MIGRAGGIELVEKPQALLGKRQRERVGVWHGQERGQGRAGWQAVREQGGETGDGRRGEDLLERYLATELLAQPRDHLCG